MPALDLQCEVKSFRMLTSTVFELTFEPHLAVDFAAGQFISVVIPGAGPKGRDLRRAYSIASSPEARPIELCVKLVEGGPGTQYLYGLRPGDKFRGFAPYGDFVYRAKPGRHACFIATGTGIAPFRSMILSETFRGAPPVTTHCLLGVREEADLMYGEDLGKIAEITWVPAVSRPCTGQWDGYCGRVTDYLRSLGPSFPWTETEFYLCGAGAMIDEVKLFLAGLGVQKESIHQEVYYKTPKVAAVAHATEVT